MNASMLRFSRLVVLSDQHVSCVGIGAKVVTRDKRECLCRARLL